MLKLIKAILCALLSFRYYFRVQAKNVFGVGPFSETLSYVTESGCILSSPATVNFEIA